MASEPPPKKLGSLRDRIAAFEAQKSSDAAAGPKPPAPGGPKPPVVRREWKPTPVQAEPAADEKSKDDKEKEQHRAGMSAADAKASIGGGSLKERMAALKGKGAFGAPAPAAAPPLAPKPKKWEIPSALESTSESQAAPDVSSSQDSETKDETTTTADDEEKAAPTEEEEEAGRRRAIAARMARLGGAKIGMAPPVFAKKPSYRRPSEDDAPPAPKPEAEVASPTAKDPERNASEGEVKADCKFLKLYYSNTNALQPHPRSLYLLPPHQKSNHPPTRLVQHPHTLTSSLDPDEQLLQGRNGLSLRHPLLKRRTTRLSRRTLYFPLHVPPQRMIMRKQRALRMVCSSFMSSLLGWY
jgi:hypothetical protein